MLHPDLIYHHRSPSPDIQLYVDGFWQLQHTGQEDREVIILPDGKIDLFLSKSAAESFQITLVGLTALPEKVKLTPGLQIFAISFHPIAVEYILRRPVNMLLNNGEELSTDFWGFNPVDLNDFTRFCEKANKIIEEQLPRKPDYRIVRMQELLLETKGDVTVGQIEKHCFFSARSFNRYWMQHLGIPLKTYLQLLRFRSAFPQIKKGKLYPEANYADQSHFIKEVKQLSGHLPKELLKNKDGRFIQFSILD